MARRMSAALRQLEAAGVDVAEKQSAVQFAVAGSGGAACNAALGGQRPRRRGSEACGGGER
jgi:hypothetical protein